MDCILLIFVYFENFNFFIFISFFQFFSLFFVLLFKHSQFLMWFYSLTLGEHNTKNPTWKSFIHFIFQKKWFLCVISWYFGKWVSFNSSQPTTKIIYSRKMLCHFYFSVNTLFLYKIGINVKVTLCAIIIYSIGKFELIVIVK